MIRGSAAELNSVCQCIVVEASVAECFAAASGFEDYPKWAGAIQSLQVLEPAQGSTPATLVEWTMGMFGITTKNKMRYSYELPGPPGTPMAGRATMKWHVTEGGIKELVGRYQFLALGPSTTKVVYNLFVEPGFRLPEMIKRATNRAVAKAALVELKVYTEERRSEQEQRKEQLLEAKGALGGADSSRRRVQMEHGGSEGEHVHTWLCEFERAFWGACNNPEEDIELAFSSPFLSH